MNYYYNINFDFTNDEHAFIKDISFKHFNNATSFTPKGSWHGDTYKSAYFYELDPTLIENKLWSKISLFTQNIETHNTADKIFKLAHIAYIKGKLSAHVDYRKCVLTYPVQFIDPIYWYSSNNDDDLVYQTNYKENSFILVNTEIYHGCHTNTTERILFQIGGFTKPITEVYELLDRT